MIGLFFDGRFINATNPDGITRFSIGLINELSKLSELSVLVSSPDQVGFLPAGTRTKMVNAPTSLSELLLARKLNRENAKVVFSPMQTTSSFGKRFKLVLTLHDLIYYRHKTPPSQFNPLVRLGWLLFHLSYLPQRLVLNRADLVVTVSETSKREIQEANLTKRDVQVVYNSTDLEPRVPSEGLRPKTLVYMGSFIDYKNVEFLIQAMSLLPDYQLVLLSRIDPRRRRALAKLASDYGSDVRFENGVDQEQYIAWLTRARALVSASKDEGFGIPLVESMSQGLPLVLSKIDIFEEIAGDAGLYFDNSNMEEFAARVLQLEDESVWLQQSQQGLARSKDFSWAESAKKLHELLSSLS